MSDKEDNEKSNPFGRVHSEPTREVSTLPHLLRQAGGEVPGESNLEEDTAPGDSDASDSSDASDAEESFELSEPSGIDDLLDDDFEREVLAAGESPDDANLRETVRSPAAQPANLRETVKAQDVSAAMEAKSNAEVDDSGKGEKPGSETASSELDDFDLELDDSIFDNLFDE